MAIKSRLKKAEEKFCEQLHEYLTNPKNENLPNEIVEPKIKEYFNEFFQSLIADEDECAIFISKGNILNEMELLPQVFEHFKSVKIYEAIKANCEVAFSQKFSIESENLLKARKRLLAHIEEVLNIKDI